MSGSSLKTRFNKIVKKYYSSSHLVYLDENKKELKESLFDSKKYSEKDTSIFILRGDILPKPRELFISLMKDSVDDILLTGDQSLTDGLSYCKNNKRIWYQVVPWKQEFAYELGKIIPNKYLDNFKTSCGVIKGIKLPLNNSALIKNYDFRKLGKKRMDSLLIQNRLLDNEVIKDYIECFESSRKKETFLKKFIDRIEK